MCTVERSKKIAVLGTVYPTSTKVEKVTCQVPILRVWAWNFEGFSDVVVSEDHLLETPIEASAVVSLPSPLASLTNSFWIILNKLSLFNVKPNGLRSDPKSSVAISALLLCSWGEGKQKKTVITKRYKPCCAKTFV